MVEREEGVVRNAVLVGVTDLKSDVSDGLARITGLRLDVHAIQADVRSGLDGVDNSLQFILANTNNGIAVAEHMDTNLNAVLANTRQIDAYIRSK